MSIQALSWALDHRQTGHLPAEVRLVLVSLADYADPTGRGARPSANTVAARLGITVRSVRRSFRALEDAGLIRYGDQQLNAHVRADRRSVVWDLALDGVQVVLRVTGEEVDLSAEPYDRDRHGVTPPSSRESVDNPARGDAHGRHGVTPASPNPTTEPIHITPLRSKGDTSARERRHVSDCAAAAWSGPAATAPGCTCTAPLALSRPLGPDRDPIRAVGMTDSHCPACGERIHRTHRCRSSALTPTPPLPPPATIQRPPAPPPFYVTDQLPLDEHEPCTLCGTTLAVRPLIEDTGLCTRCYVANYPRASGGEL